MFTANQISSDPEIIKEQKLVVHVCAYYSPIV